MPKLAALIAAAVLLVACSDTFDPQVKREYTLNEVMVKWVEVDSEAALYAACQNVGMDSKVLACASYNKVFQTCTIYTHRNPSLDLMGHEMLHCFSGAWHS